MLRIGSFLLAAAVLSSCATPQPATPTEPVRLTLLGINDLHGALLDRPVGAAQEGPKRGGAALLASYIAAARAENPEHTLLLDAGDMLQGPLLVNRFEGLPVAELYGHLGVDAAALGNHELDYGPVGEAGARDPGIDPQGALEAFLAAATFPVLSANLASDGGPLPDGLQRSVLLDAGGVSVGVVGLSTVKTIHYAVGGTADGLSVEPPGPAAVAEIAALREAGAQVVVVVGHLDGGCVGDDAGPVIGHCEPDGELADVLEAAPGQIDAIVLGHRHAHIGALADGVPVVEAGARGRWLSRIDLVFDPSTGRVDPSRSRAREPTPLCAERPTAGSDCLDPRAEGPWSPLLIDGRPIEPDPAVGALLAPWVERVAALCTERLATAERSLQRTRGSESALGNLATDALLAAVPEADIALVNSGSLRADLNAGPIGFCDAYGVLPIDSRVVQVRLTGAELLELLRIGTSGAHSLLQVSGLRLVLGSADAPARDRNGDGRIEDWEVDRLLSVRLADGRAIAPDEELVVLLPDYVYERKDDMVHLFGGVDASRATVHDLLVRDAVVDLLRSDDRVLGADGGWPLPQEGSPRIRVLAGLVAHE